jgi:hypothetical protein
VVDLGPLVRVDEFVGNGAPGSIASLEWTQAAMVTVAWAVRAGCADRFTATLMADRIVSGRHTDSA